MAECPHSEGVFSYLLEPIGAEAERFYAHAQTCSVCRSVLADCRRIEDSLSMDPGSESGRREHPAPEMLHAFQNERDLSSEERVEIARHLEDCAQCRTELTALRRFDFARAASLAAARRASASPDHGGRQEAEVGRAGTFSDLLGRMAGWLGLPESPLAAWPAVASLLLLIGAGVLWLATADRPGSGELREGQEQSPQLAERSVEDEGGSISDSSGDRSNILRPEEPIERRIGERSEDDRGGAPAEDLVSPPAERSLARAERPGASVVLPPADDEVESSGGRPDTREEYPEELNQGAVREELLLASIGDWPEPSYERPAGAAFFERSRIVVRGPGDADSSPEPRPLAPDHEARTIQPSPTLYWLLPERSAAGVEITIVRASDDAVVLEYQQPGPIEAGLQRVDLAERGLSLELDTSYRWYVSLVVDPRRRSLDRRGSAAIRRVAPPDGLPERTLAADSPGHAYASEGLWYDALGYFVELAERAEVEEQGRALRDALLESAGLPTPD